MLRYMNVTAKQNILIFQVLTVKFVILLNMPKNVMQGVVRLNDNQRAL